MLLLCGRKGRIAIFVASFKRWLPSLLIMPGVAIFSLADERTVVQMEEVRNRNAETERRVEGPGATAGTGRDDQQMGGQQTAGSDATPTHPTNDSASNFPSPPARSEIKHATARFAHALSEGDILGEDSSERVHDGRLERSTIPGHIAATRSQSPCPCTSPRRPPISYPRPPVPCGSISLPPLCDNTRSGIGRSIHS